jgi:MFS family permease
LYALFFVHTGVSVNEITGLFALWSIVGIIAEIPAGALADRYSRRGSLVAAGLLQAGGYALWILLPGLPAFAGGFVCWGVASALVSGALEALLYDGLAAAKAETAFPAVLGKVTAASLFAQLPAAAVAALVFSVGGFALAGWVSVGFCLAAAALATRLPEPPRATVGEGEQEDGPGGYWATLRAGLAETAARPAVRRAVLAVAMLSGLDALDEYFPILAHDWTIPTAAVPFAILSIPLVGAACAAAGGSARRLRPWALGVLLVISGLVLGAAALWKQPAGLLGIALFYGIYRLVLVVVNARLQAAIKGPSRATVTSVAAFGTEIATFGLYAVWVLGGALLVAFLVAGVGVFLPRLSSDEGQSSASSPD